jgi:divinyl protochlorophyllide a 8-vinyl-reductase
MSTTKQPWVENSIMRLALETTEATLSKSGYYAVAHLAGLDRYLETPPPNNNRLTTPGEDFAALMNGIITMYGEPASRGIFRRWGRHFAMVGVNRRLSAHILKPMLVLLPLQRRMHTVLNALMNEANTARGENLHAVNVVPTAYLFTFRDCLYCHGLHPSEPVCYPIVGIIEAVLQWGTGREFAVRETHCQARGADACVFEILKPTRHD